MDHPDSLPPALRLLRPLRAAGGSCAQRAAAWWGPGDPGDQWIHVGEHLRSLGYGGFHKWGVPQLAG